MHVIQISLHKVYMNFKLKMKKDLNILQQLVIEGKYKMKYVNKFHRFFIHKYLKVIQ